MDMTGQTAAAEMLEQATEQVVRYFVAADDPLRKSHKRSVEAILGRYIRPTPVAVTVVRQPGTATVPERVFIEEVKSPLPLTTIVEAPDTEPDFGIKGMPHVRGDVRAKSMGRKSMTVAGNRYIVSYRARGDEGRQEALSFEAMLLTKTLNAAGEEVLEFDNGVRIIDDLERFRFQRSG